METKFYYIDGHEVFEKRITLFPKKMTTSLNNDQTNIIDKIFDNQYITYYNDHKYYKSYEVAKMLCKFPDLESLDNKTKIREWLEIKGKFFKNMVEQYNLTCDSLSELQFNEHIKLVVEVSEKCSKMANMVSEIVNLMLNDHNRLNIYMKTIINSYYNIINTKENTNINDNTLLHYMNNLHNVEDIFFFELLFIIRIQEYMRETLTNNTIILKKVMNII